MELKAFIGEHVLDAVDFDEESVKAEYGDYYENCSVCRFRLDGNVYVAVEDPEDGYRSCLREIKIMPDATMKNVFPEGKVFARHRTEGEYSSKDDVIEFIDMTTGEVVLEIGTCDLDDYYPGFVANFNPAAMACNKTPKA